MTVELTEGSYVRWLRARQPQPLDFFLSLKPSEQEVLAGLGDGYTEDVCIAMGYCVHDPDAVAAGSDDEGAEERLAQRVAGELLNRAMAQRGQNATGSPANGDRPGMSGVTQRRQVRAFEEARGNQEGKSLFGNPPDPVESPSPIDTLVAEEEA